MLLKGMVGVTGGQSFSPSPSLFAVAMNRLGAARLEEEREE